METKNPNVLFSFYTFGNWVFIFCWFSRWICLGFCQGHGCFYKRLPVSKFWIFGLEEKAPKTNTWVEILALCFPSWDSGTLAFCNMQRLFLHVVYYIALDWSPPLNQISCKCSLWQMCRLEILIWPKAHLDHRIAGQSAVIAGHPWTIGFFHLVTLQSRPDSTMVSPVPCHFPALPDLLLLPVHLDHLHGLPNLSIYTHPAGDDQVLLFLTMCISRSASVH